MTPRIADREIDIGIPPATGATATHQRFACFLGAAAAYMHDDRQEHGERDAELDGVPRMPATRANMPPLLID